MTAIESPTTGKEARRRIECYWRISAPYNYLGKYD
jgi:hypothetical protein